MTALTSSNGVYMASAESAIEDSYLLNLAQGAYVIIGWRDDAVAEILTAYVLGELSIEEAQSQLREFYPGGKA